MLGGLPFSESGILFCFVFHLDERMCNNLLASICMKMIPLLKGKWSKWKFTDPEHF